MLSLEKPEYLAHQKKLWRSVLPKVMIIVEYQGTGDPAFGGTADDRPLGENGIILSQSSNLPRAEFLTIEAAHEAAKEIKNRRQGSILGVIPTW